MTYDELYKKVEGIWHDSFKSPEMTALFNVTKLHKPYDFKWGEDEFTACGACGEPDYPCKTLKTIEEDLS